MDPRIEAGPYRTAFVHPALPKKPRRLTELGRTMAWNQLALCAGGFTNVLFYAFLGTLSSAASALSTFTMVIAISTFMARSRVFTRKGDDDE